MKQADFNNIKHEDLAVLLARYPDRSVAVEVALSVLGDDAKRWHSYRTSTTPGRIIDMETGKWVSQFEANGRRYYIRTAKDGLGFRRYVEMRKILSIVGFNATFSEQLASIDRCVEAANSLVTKTPKLADLFRELENMRSAIRTSDRKWDYSLYAATLFIVREGEDLTTWDESLAEDKINDWHQEGLHEQDFFLLVMFWATQLSEWWRDLPAKIRHMAPEVSPLAG